MTVHVVLQAPIVGCFGRPRIGTWNKHFEIEVVLKGLSNNSLSQKAPGDPGSVGDSCYRGFADVANPGPVRTQEIKYKLHVSASCGSPIRTSRTAIAIHAATVLALPACHTSVIYTNESALFFSGLSSGQRQKA